MDQICGHRSNTSYQKQILNWALAIACTAVFMEAMQQYLVYAKNSKQLFLIFILNFIAYLTSRFNYVSDKIILIYFYFSICAGISLGWFVADGMAGGIGFYFTIAQIVIVLLYQGKTRIFLSLFLVLLVAILILIEYKFHTVPHEFLIPTDKFTDRMFGVIISSIITLSFLHIIFNYLESEKARANELLHSILPQEIVENLESGAFENSTNNFASAGVVFIEIVGFYKISHRLGPAKTVYLLNSAFSHFDLLAEQYHINKIKTVGNIYMAASMKNAQPSDYQQESNLVKFALQLIKLSQKQTFLGERLVLRIGMHFGPLTAGVIGYKTFIYDVWGDTVNTASRMMTQGEAQCIQVTDSSYELIKNDFELVQAGDLIIKGKGLTRIWRIPLSPTNLAVIDRDPPPLRPSTVQEQLT